MENYLIGFLPVVSPQDDMKIEIGGVLGSVTIGDLKKYIKGENTTTGLTLNPSAVTITANDLINTGITFKISGSDIADLGYHWVITGDISEGDLYQVYSDNQDTLELKLKSLDSIKNYPAEIKIEAGDENWSDEQFATITVIQ